jgi:hypothetical protein
MKILKIESYNGGDILKIYFSNSDFYYFDTINKVELDLTPTQIENLSADVLQINCASFC